MATANHVTSWVFRLCRRLAEVSVDSVQEKRDGCCSVAQLIRKKYTATASGIPAEASAVRASFLCAAFTSVTPLNVRNVVQFPEHWQKDVGRLLYAKRMLSK